MNAVTMISWELDPFHVRGGTAYAIRRLADQLTEQGIETRVLLPDWLDTRPGNDLPPLLRPILVNMRAELPRGPGLLQSSWFCHAALAAVEETAAGAESAAVVAHCDEGAMFTILRRGRRPSIPSVFWLHSLWDPPIRELSKAQRRRLPSPSLLASAVTMADLVVTSAGILKDANELEWPGSLRALQTALMMASREGRVLTVESTGCLPAVAKSSHQRLIPRSSLEGLSSVPSPYVLFPGRPAVDKGFGMFVAIAERLAAHDIACVAVERPAKGRSSNPALNAAVCWSRWLAQDELFAAMRNAACTVLPSISEGFGLATAESIAQGTPTLYQQVGGHHALDGLPNAVPVRLTSTERAQLYLLWSELVSMYPDGWGVWARHERALRPLVDKWVEAIRAVVDRGRGGRGEIGGAEFPEVPVEERWGNRLRRRIEAGTNAQEC